MSLPTALVVEQHDKCSDEHERHERKPDILVHQEVTSQITAQPTIARPKPQARPFRKAIVSGGSEPPLPCGPSILSIPSGWIRHCLFRIVRLCHRRLGGSRLDVLAPVPARTKSILLSSWRADPSTSRKLRGHKLDQGTSGLASSFA
jgi:hypothetical protein